ncbi:hypothetical protein GCM10022417_07270 [Corynebacterium pilbarense]
MGQPPPRRDDGEDDGETGEDVKHARECIAGAGGGRVWECGKYLPHCENEAPARPIGTCDYIEDNGAYGTASPIPPN